MRLIVQLLSLLVRGAGLMLGLAGLGLALASLGGAWSDRLDALTHAAPLWLPGGTFLQHLQKRNAHMSDIL